MIIIHHCTKKRHATICSTNWTPHHLNLLIVEQLNWNRKDLMAIVNERVLQLNVEQTILYQKILTLVNEHNGTTFPLMD
jgi:hypothetical protein